WIGHRSIRLLKGTSRCYPTTPDAFPYPRLTRTIDSSSWPAIPNGRIQRAITALGRRGRILRIFTLSAASLELEDCGNAYRARAVGVAGENRGGYRVVAPAQRWVIIGHVVSEHR